MTDPLFDKTSIENALAILNAFVESTELRELKEKLNAQLLALDSSEDPVTFQYLVIHEACKNRAGILASQAGHAANECVIGRVSSRNRICALQAKMSSDLQELSELLTAGGVKHVLITEPDAPWNGAATALGTRPVPLAEKELIMKFFVKYKLL